MDVGGQDATEAFEDVGHSDEAREILDGLLVGALKRAVRPPPTLPSYSDTPHHLAYYLQHPKPSFLASPVNCIPPPPPPSSIFLPSHSMPMCPRADIPNSPATQHPKPNPPNPQQAPRHPTAPASASVSTPSSSSAPPSRSARTSTYRCRARRRNEVSSYQPAEKVNRQVGERGEGDTDRFQITFKLENGAIVLCHGHLVLARRFLFIFRGKWSIMAIACG